MMPSADSETTVWPPCAAAEPCRMVDVHPDVALVADLRLAPVQADPHPDRETERPLVVAKSAMDGERRSGRGCACRKDGEELVSSGPDR